MQRRRLLTSASALTAAALLGGCGFALRRPPQFDFHTIALRMPAEAPFTQALRQQLQDMGRVRVLDDAQKADVVLESPGAERERLIFSTTGTGEVREVQLRISLPFSLRTSAGQELLPPSTIERVMDQSYSETLALAKEQEAHMLYQHLQGDIIEQLIRRLATVRVPRP